MTIRIEVEGLDRLRKEFSNLDQQFDVAVSDAIEDTALAIRNRIISGIQKGPKTGRVYEKYNPRRTHRASAPGQPPATDTGRLVGSIYYDIDPMTATVGSRLVYAQYLEFGTRKMAARPIWIPVANSEGDKLRDRIMANLRRVLP